MWWMPITDFDETQWERMRDYRRGVLTPFALAGIPAVLVLLEPDFGSTVYLLFMAVLVMWMGGAQIASGGPVTVSVADVTTMGLNSNGVFAYSSGSDADGAVSVNRASFRSSELEPTKTTKSPGSASHCFRLL